MAKHNWLTSLIPGYGMYTIVDNLFGKGGYLANVASSLSGKYLGTNMTGQDREANDFNKQMQEDAQQHDKDMADYNDQLARQYYQDVQSPQAQVQQYMNAGLNPALMYGKGAGSVPSPANFGSSGASGTQSVKPTAGDVGQLFSTLAGIGFRKKELAFQKDVADSTVSANEAKAAYFLSLATGQGNENSVFQERYDYWKRSQDKSLAEVDANIFLKTAQADLARQQINESSARETLLKWQSLTAQVEAKYAEVAQQDLHRLRETAMDLNVAHQDYLWNQSAESRQRLDEAEKSWETRMAIFKENLRKLSAEAGMTEKEIEAFWTDKRIQEMVAMSEMFDNYKQEFKAFGIGGNGVGLNMWNGKTAPSMYSPLYE